MSHPTGGVRYGFEWDDVRQERAIGAIMAERTKPGDSWAAYSRGKVRVARHRKKEAQWNTFKISIRETSKGDDFWETKYNQILIHEILDLLPYSFQNKVKKALEIGDGRTINKVGRLIREMLPHLVRKES